MENSLPIFKISDPSIFTDLESETAQIISEQISQVSYQESESFIIEDNIPIAEEKEIFLHEINVFQDTLFNNVNLPVLPERIRPVISEQIKIEPNNMVFKGAYDGKLYKETITITNCGNKSINVRILSPSSKAFKIKPILLPYRLSPGLSLSRNINYLYTKPTAIPQASMDIYINNELISYEFLVLNSYTCTEIMPKILDFGEIDVGSVSEMKKLIVRNTGTKQAKYSIGLGDEQFELIIQPMKGIILPGDSQEISVEVFGTIQGEFHQEFWVKTDPLQRIQVRGRFIEPMLSVEYPFAESNSVLLNYPVTFVGTKRYRNVIFRNHSSFSSVFCVLRKIHGIQGGKIPFEEDRESDENCRQFNVFPLEGKLNSDGKCLLEITYAPQEPLNGRTFHIGTVCVEFVKCKAGFESQQDCNIHLDSNSSEVLSITTLDEKNEPDQEIQVTKTYIAMYLYGEIDIPKVTLTPEKIYLPKLIINELQVQTLTMLNHSETLPLVIRYKKVPCIEILPKELILTPKEPTYATIKIKPCKMGQENVTVTFELLYRGCQGLTKVGRVEMEVHYFGEYAKTDKLVRKHKELFLTGITPTISNEVGYLVDDVRFNSKVQKPVQAIVDNNSLVFDKSNDALIAFPNDRPKCLRPWRKQVPCKTIFAKLPRIVTNFDKDYDLPINQKILKDKTRSYYNSYIRQRSKHQQPKILDDTLFDYETTNSKLLLLENQKCINTSSLTLISSYRKALFVPLTPYEIRNIIVTPKFIQLGLLGANTKCSDYFSLENKNTFPIHVAINALFPSIEFTQNEFILKSSTKKNVNFIYHTSGGGKKHNTLFIILNFFYTFNVTVLATIVANTVKCITKAISMALSEKTAFLELKNPINSDVKFQINTDFSHLEPFPVSGVIPAKRNMTCAITFNPEVGFIPMKEITLVSESGARELIEVSFEWNKIAIGLSTDKVVFDNIPLNSMASHEITVKNNSDYLISGVFEIENHDLYPEISIDPQKSLIFQRGFVILTIRVQFKQILSFNVTLNMEFQNELTKKIVISGNVVFPEITFSSHLIKLPKIPSEALLRTPFKIQNITNVTNYVSFCPEDYPEFTILDKGGEIIEKLFLNPNEKKDLILEFHPKEPVAYCIYLPYTLNGILGPPELNRPLSLKCSEYLFPSQVDSQRHVVNITSKLNVMKILCAAGKNWLSFSTLEVDFLNFDEVSKTVIVTNKTEDNLEILFKINHVKMFLLTPDNSEICNINDNNFDVTLEPEETFTINVEFRPEQFGTYTEEIPVYVASYSESNPYNHLRLTGNNKKPVISIDKTIIYFSPINICTKIQDVVTLELENHKCDGIIDIQYEEKGILVSFKEMKHISPSKSRVSYTITFFAKEDCGIEYIIKFLCPCEAQIELLVNGWASSALVINFMSDPALLEYSTYPYFPNENNKSPYGTFMRSIVPIIEKWLYCQGFFYQQYYSIPEDIARYPVETYDGVKKKTAGKKKDYVQLPLVQLLVNLMDTSILKYIDNRISPSEALIEGTLYNYTTYRNVISFLKSQNIFVPGLKPEHLLRYTEYVVFKEKFIDKDRLAIEESFTEESFRAFSKQRWLDLIFHIFKVLVLERITNLNYIQDKNQCEYITKENEAIQKYYEKNKQRFSSWFHSEARLLLWAEYHYNKQKKILWPEEKFQKQQNIKSFKDFYNSVFFITLTAAYCPYIKNLLCDVYPFPHDDGHLVHNACKIVQIWKSLKFSMDVHPQTIVAGNEIKILLIVMYLYEVLPNYFPTTEINIDTPLSGSASYEITVQNCGNVPIQYQAIFFENDSNVFDLDSYVINIPSGKSKKIKLSFFAKMVLPVSSILLLSGETFGQRYAKSQVIIVNGIPNVSECEVIKAQVATYVELEKKFDIKTPYGKKYNAKIFMCFDQPKSKEDLVSISTIKSRRLIREFSMDQTDCEFVDKGEGSVLMNFIFLSQGEISFYLYFCNQEIGDFCVLFSILSTFKAKGSSNGTIAVSLSNNFSDQCICKKTINMKCSKIFTVDIPCRNELFWKSMNTMVQMCFSEATYNFFKKYLDTALALRILEYHIENMPNGSLLPATLFQSFSEFEIVRSKTISSPEKHFIIKDVISQVTVPLILHWDSGQRPNVEYLELRNINQKEARLYKLVFPKMVKDESTSQNLSDSNNAKL